MALFPTLPWQLLLTARYPENVGQPPFDKWIRFDVKSGRHVGRNVIVREMNGTDRTLASVGLYLPSSALKSTIEARYESNAMGPFWGAAIEQLAQTGTNLFDTKFNSIADASKAFARLQGDVSQTVGNLASSGSQSIIDILKQQIKDGMSGLASTLAGAPENVGDIITGRKTNPRTDMFFDSVEYRSHELTFTLIPRTRAEAIAIDNIVHLFQFYMLPAFHNTTEEGQAAQLGAFLIGFPYEFEITMLDGTGQELGHINKIGRSALTNVGVDHSAGDNVAFIRDGKELYPVRTELNLTFQEVRLLGRDREEINRKDITQSTLDDPRVR